ncbi:MAG: hypothetical protein DI585_00285 [Pseudomonas fluorescens]|nr:MAG: hypothetical protein DI585_00285 [Pseudomonas fluorescens]
MSQSTPYTKFGFDTEFFELVPGRGQDAAPGAAPAAPVSKPLPTSPAQMREQLEEQRQQGYEEGHAAGMAEGLSQGMAQSQADLAQLQQHLQNTLMALQNAQTERDEQLLNQCLSLLRVTLHRLVGHAATHFGPELLEHHLRELLPLVKSDESLTLHIHPVARGFHEKLGLPQASIMGLPMHVQTDSSLGQTDAVIQWANGGAESKLAVHLMTVDTLLAGVGAQSLAIPTRTDLEPAPFVPATPASQPAQSEPAPAASLAHDDVETAASRAADARARALLGDDDDLVDALK